jgi:hypothetical protein
MFKDVQADSDNMIVEIREFLDFISLHHPQPPITTPRHLNTAKGLIYVQLYGVIENTVLKTLSKTIDYLNSESLSLSKLKYSILALVLDNELNSLINTVSKKWDKRNDLFLKIKSDDRAIISNTLCPTDGKNIGANQLNSIWRTFELISPIFSDLTFTGRLRDIVSNRINIAHGNTTASEVGKLVTMADLYTRIQEVSAYCSHFISAFDGYMQSKEYLNK